MRPAGTQIGAYTILGPLGKGGMGEVYRARDTRLHRDVALKILPETLAGDRELLHRFQSEALSASALNHPSIVTVYDVGQVDGTPYIAMELVEGRTLRDLLDEKAIGLRRAVEIAAQVAAGLAAAHGKGIVHRDLKPRNVMVTGSGLAKVLDFGLAKMLGPLAAGPDDSTTGLDAPHTAPGVVLGTVGYMSPEQAAGRPVDARSDQFSLGSILYEMLTGRQAFRRATPAETMSAIIRDEPEPISGVDPRVETPLRWILGRCLAKDPEHRYASTHDLAGDLERLVEEVKQPTTSHVVPPQVPWPRRAYAPAAAALVGAALVVALQRGLPAREPATFTQLTFERGTIWSGRFAPDGETVFYSAAWDAAPFRLFRKSPEATESEPLSYPDADILSISRAGEMATLVDVRILPPGRTAGVLAQAPLTGGAPRPLAEDVSYGDWAPAGRELAVVRAEAGKSVLEFPIGTSLHRSAGWLSHPRVSPRGDLVAFIEHPIPADDRGSVAVVDLTGRVRRLSDGWGALHGLAWSPAGDEIWVSGSRQGPHAVHAVALSGESRLLVSGAGRLKLLDVSRSGRALVVREDRRVGINFGSAAGGRERELSHLDSSLLVDLSADGRTILFSEFGEGGGPLYSVYLGRNDGSQPVRMGDGAAKALSPDGRWTLTAVPGSPPRLLLLPTGPGQPRPVDAPFPGFHPVSFFPDGRRILFAAGAEGRGARLHVLDFERGSPEAIGPEGIWVEHFQGWPISPDSRWVAAVGPEAQLKLYPLDGGEPRAVEGVARGSVPIRWSSDGQSLFTFRMNELPVRVFRVDPFRGRKTLWRELAPGDRTGVHGLPVVLVTPDGRFYAYSYARFLCEMYLVKGLG